MAPPDFSLSLGDIEHIADLARLELAASEAEHMHAQLSHFFKFVAQIQAVDTHGIEPLVYPVEEGCTPRLRDDTLTESPERDACQNGAPDIYNGLYRVPQVIE
ncbi:Aspartyl/glutamyl-tRNA(Asn/Gln) amidotransferase subunit C (Asp/Glu-ADT subunit C) [Candidatus Glomeribacter gigasporarum BEG34]|uniref:Aspartyl/glutamyl-tRNA(Asn/Gln) amidotransferase subunit C n=1 Tax=Candidatus Glomeribacter gigasporarum BEG34 TaxID=1070319 RepID=G2J7I2_9BURK|nr:Asp-tRNA(Asn)/Glu-tRNA(Gln) amidotransferase subunit GatC [Candidatus Glomeribacter gigasporarum]CCD28727.1 Aspartyl/glutamyl-tRNA(Asn/Gln) amidotransferase subunit C (Asp/Glu-ADT subunit C) [Candidatus Glomeribacter gigasporarum BEG34]